MTRAMFWSLLALGFLIVLTVIFVTAMNLARHPSPPPINHCSGSDSANRWCIR